MKNIDLNFLIKDISGNEIKDANAGRLLANALVFTSNGDIFKHYDWAKSLAEGKSISIDRSDAEYLRYFITKHDNLSILVKAQILEVFDK